MSNIGIIISRYLPLRLSLAMQAIPADILQSVNEIRLRKKQPISLTIGMRNVFFDQSGTICRMSNGVCITESELAECISKLTCGSLYTCDASPRADVINRKDAPLRTIADAESRIARQDKHTEAILVYPRR